MSGVFSKRESGAFELNGVSLLRCERRTIDMALDWEFLANVRLKIRTKALGFTIVKQLNPRSVKEIKTSVLFNTVE